MPHGAPSVAKQILRWNMVAIAVKQNQTGGKGFQTMLIRSGITEGGITMRCPYNHNCLHCPLPDCKYNDDHFLTKEESQLLKNIHGGWDDEEKASLLTKMERAGYNSKEIILALGININKYYQIKRKAARDCNHKAANKKPYTKSITA